MPVTEVHDELELAEKRERMGDNDDDGGQDGGGGDGREARADRADLPGLPLISLVDVAIMPSRIVEGGRHYRQEVYAFVTGRACGAELGGLRIVSNTVAELGLLGVGHTMTVLEQALVEGLAEQLTALVTKNNELGMWPNQADHAERQTRIMLLVEAAQRRYNRPDPSVSLRRVLEDFYFEVRGHRLDAPNTKACLDQITAALAGSLLVDLNELERLSGVSIQPRAAGAWCRLARVVEALGWDAPKAQSLAMAVAELRARFEQMANEAEAIHWQRLRARRHAARAAAVVAKERKEGEGKEQEEEREPNAVKRALEDGQSEEAGAPPPPAYRLVVGNDEDDMPPPPVYLEYHAEDDV